MQTLWHPELSAEILQSPTLQLRRKKNKIKQFGNIIYEMSVLKSQDSSSELAAKWVKEKVKNQTKTAANHYLPNSKK